MAGLFFTSQSKLSHVWIPTDIAGCKLWLRADQGITLNTGNVSGWNDYSGGNYHCAQPVAIRQPLFNSSDADFNNKPSITFDGSNDYLIRNTGDFNITGKIITTYIVMKWIGGIEQAGIFSIYNDNVGGIYDWNNYGAIVVAMNYPAGTLSFYRNGLNKKYGVIPAGAAILSMIDDGVNMKTYLNGVFIEQVASNQNYTTEQYIIGCRMAGSPSYFSNCKISEQITYETALGTTDNTTVINYLKALYGIA